MVANIRCAEIKDDQLRNLVSDQAWQALAGRARSGVVAAGFGATRTQLGKVIQILCADTTGGDITP